MAVDAKQKGRKPKRYGQQGSGAHRKGDGNTSRRSATEEEGGSRARIKVSSQPRRSRGVQGLKGGKGDKSSRSARKEQPGSGARGRRGREPKEAQSAVSRPAALPDPPSNRSKRSAPLHGSFSADRAVSIGSCQPFSLMACSLPSAIRPSHLAAGPGKNGTCYSEKEEPTPAACRPPQHLRSRVFSPLAALDPELRESFFRYCKSACVGSCGSAHIRRLQLSTKCARFAVIIGESGEAPRPLSGFRACPLFLGAACRVVSCHVMSHHVTSRHVISCHVVDKGR